MQHVFLDTTVLRADPRRQKIAFRLLGELAESNQVKIHLSEMTKREFLSQELETLDESKRNLEKSIRRISKLRAMSSVQLATIELGAGSLRAAVSAIESIKGVVSEDFANWAAKSDVRIHPIADKHGARVVEKYFRENRHSRKRSQGATFRTHCCGKLCLIWQGAKNT